MTYIHLNLSAVQMVLENASRMEGAALVTEEWRWLLIWGEWNDYAGDPSFTDFISLELAADGRFLVAAYGDLGEKLVWDALCGPAYRDVTPEVVHETR